MPAYAQLLVILAAMVGFWAIVMRPARNQQRKVQRLQQELEVGQDVVLSAGIFGTIRSLTETKVGIEVAPGTIITVARQVVVRRADEVDDAGRSDRSSDPEPTDPSGPPRTED